MLLLECIDSMEKKHSFWSTEDLIQKKLLKIQNQSKEKTVVVILRGGLCHMLMIPSIQTEIILYWLANINVGVN